MEKFVLLEKMAVIDIILEELTATEQMHVLVECLAAKAVLHKKEEKTVDECVAALQKYLREQILAYHLTKQKLEGRE